MISCIYDGPRGCHHLWMGDERVMVSFDRWNDDPVVHGAFERLKTYFQVTGEPNLVTCRETITTTRLFNSLYYRINNLHRVRRIAEGSVFA